MKRGRKARVLRKGGSLYLRGRKLHPDEYVKQWNCQEGWSITLQDQSKYRLRGAV